MKRHDEDLSRVESVTTIIVNIGTIISWAITLITALALIYQPQPVVIPGLFELGKPYTITFLISILFGYIQLLRHFWRRSRLSKANSESTFASYIFMSVVKFRRPFVLIGFVLIFIAIFQIDPTNFSVIAGLVFIVGLSTLLTGYLNEAVNPIKTFFWSLDDDFTKRWLKRVKNQLQASGYVFTSDFSNLNIDEGEINWAIEIYFNRYEFDQDLILTKRSYRELLEDHYFIELRFDHLPTRLQKK